MYFLAKTIRCRMLSTLEMKILQLITNISAFNYFEAGWKRARVEISARIFFSRKIAVGNR
jgi:hypothetical protein